MKLTTFMVFARSELSAMAHPSGNGKVDQLADIETLARVVDYVLAKGEGTHGALAEGFYDAFGRYLNAPRNRKIALGGAIHGLAMYFEPFLREIVRSVLPERDATLTDTEGKPRGQLSQTGYIRDFVRLLLGSTARLAEKADAQYWNARTVEEVCYSITSHHQQRAKHEARDYPLEALERFAHAILASYLFVARWLIANSNIVARIEAEYPPASESAILSWPAILAYLVSNVRPGSADQDLADHVLELQTRADALAAEAGVLRAARVTRTSDEFRSLEAAVEGLQQEYESLLVEQGMRDWSYEQQYSEYL